MQFFTLIISALAATALAAPTEHKPTTTAAAHPPTYTEYPRPGDGHNGGGQNGGGQNGGGHNGGGHNGGGQNGGGQNGGGQNGGGQNGGGNYDPCPGVTVGAGAQCCSAGVLGLVGVDCANPSAKPTSAEDFQSICKSKGSRPLCCTVSPLLGQGLICSPPVGL